MSQSIELLWPKINSIFSTIVGENRYNTWIKNSKPLLLNEDEIVVCFESTYIKDKMEPPYREIFTSCARNITNRNTKVSFIVDDSIFINSKPSHNDSTTYLPIHISVSKQTQMTFDNFIVGVNNKLAYDASKHIAENHKPHFNVLLIVGQSGLGKTHLLGSIHNYIVSNTNKVNIISVSCKNFIREYIYSLQNSKMEPFRQKYRSADILLMDDLHLLVNKEKTQETFLYTFSYLRERNKKIVITSDTYPRHIPELNRNLSTQLEDAMEVTISKPDYEARVKFLKSRGVGIPTESLEYIAKSIYTNYKDMLICLSNLMKHNNPTLSTAKAVVDDFISSNGRKLSLEDVARVTATAFSVKMKDIFSKKRTKLIATARQVCFYLSHKLTKEPLAKIGHYFGDRNHSTVLLAYKKISANKCDNHTKHSIEKIEKDLGHLNKY